ncbi:polysaccharide lyase family protein [Tamlana flava]|uniref:polysaccharide lyase family protein n=1 Tax=Tamlana flava TaxID=3158572 RepID=UPI00351BAA8B
METWIKQFFSLLFSVSFGLIINAQTIVWEGNVDSDFYNPDNWNDSTIDFSNVQSVSLIIVPGSPYDPIQIGGNAGNVDYRPGTLNTYTDSNSTFNGVLIPWSNSYLNGTITINSPGDLNIRSAVYLGNGYDATLNVNGGTIHSKNRFYLGYNNGGHAVANILGGTLSIGTSLELGTSPLGTSPTGVLNITGGIVNVSTDVNIGVSGIIKISGIGALMVAGDHSHKLSDYISTNKIISPEGKVLEVVFDGAKTIVSTAKNPDSLIKEYGNYVVLDNGVLVATIDKATANITSLKVNGIETLAQTNYSHNDRVGAYFSFNGSYGYTRLTNYHFSVKEETDDFIDVSFKRSYSEDNLLPAIDVDVHYVLKKGDTGLYSYNILNHPAEYPDFDLGIWRQVLWIAHDEAEYLAERIYVNEQKSWEMPSVYDYQNASPTSIQEIVKLNTGVRAGKYDGKYQYSENILDLPVWGHASNYNNIGSWVVFGSHEYFPQGPTSHELNAASGIIHVLFNQVHYNSKGFTIPQGEEWSKIYGPYLIYTSFEDTGSKNWENAKEIAAIERAKWPYTWLTDIAEYPQANNRGNIVGNFSITDSEKPDLDGSNVWIGVTQLNPDSGGDWQFESKSYQYWVKTNANGDFNIEHVRPGSYSLFALKTGEVGEFKMEDVVVLSDQTTDLGALNWNVPRNHGDLVWEIGVPNRTAAEYKFGDFAYCEGFVEDKFESTFPNPVEYDVSSSNWANVLPYVHTKYIASDGARDRWYWNFNFTLTDNIPATGNAKLTVAFASVDHAQFWFSLNGQDIYQSYPDVPSGGNAWLRQSNRAKYGVQVFDIPYDKFKAGNNILSFLMPSNQSNSHIMYDYISLEGNLTTTLSTQKDELTRAIKVYPTPINGKFNVILPSKMNEVTTELLNINGILISSQKHSNIQELVLDISNKPSGIYFLKVIGKEVITTLKLVKN